MLHAIVKFHITFFYAKVEKDQFNIQLRGCGLMCI